MAAQQNALRRRVTEKREEVAEDLIRLRGEIRETYETATDWRRLVRSRPLASVGLGMGLGLLLGFSVGGYFG